MLDQPLKPVSCLRFVLFLSPPFFLFFFHVINNPPPDHERNFSKYGFCYYIHSRRPMINRSRDSDKFPFRREQRVFIAHDLRPIGKQWTLVFGFIIYSRNLITSVNERSDRFSSFFAPKSTVYRPIKHGLRVYWRAKQNIKSIPIYSSQTFMFFRFLRMQRKTLFLSPRFFYCFPFGFIRGVFGVVVWVGRRDRALSALIK